MKKLTANKIFGLALCLIGILSVVFSIICFDWTNNYYERGGWEYNETYGGDAYTGIQNAAAQAANNIYDFNANMILMARSVYRYFGFSLLVTGLLAIAFGAYKFFKDVKKKEPMQVASVQAEPVQPVQNNTTIL